MGGHGGGTQPPTPQRTPSAPRARAFTGRALVASGGSMNRMLAHAPLYIGTAIPSRCWGVATWGVGWWGSLPHRAQPLTSSLLSHSLVTLCQSKSHTCVIPLIHALWILHFVMAPCLTQSFALAVFSAGPRSSLAHSTNRRYLPPPVVSILSEGISLWSARPQTQCSALMSDVSFFFYQLRQIY